MVNICTYKELVLVFSLQKIIEYKFVHEACIYYKVKKHNLHQLIYAHVQCQDTKKDSKGSNFKEDDRVSSLYITLWWLP